MEHQFLVCAKQGCSLKKHWTYSLSTIDQYIICYCIILFRFQNTVHADWYDNAVKWVKLLWFCMIMMMIVLVCLYLVGISMYTYSNVAISVNAWSIKLYVIFLFKIFLRNWIEHSVFDNDDVNLCQNMHVLSKFKHGLFCRLLAHRGKRCFIIEPAHWRQGNVCLIT